MDYFKDTALTESFILGWKYDQDVLSIYLDLYLLPSHSSFSEYDRKVYSGCFKLGLLTFVGISKLVQMKNEIVLPQWHIDLQEYHDIAEIDELLIFDKHFKCEADQLNFDFYFTSCDLRIFESEQFDF